MIIDARTLPASKVIETTACIIGRRGVAGIALARELIGRDVIANGGIESPRALELRVANIMGTFKDKQQLDDMYSRGEAPWQVWKTSSSNHSH